MNFEVFFPKGETPNIGQIILLSITDFYSSWLRKKKPIKTDHFSMNFIIQNLFPNMFTLCPYAPHVSYIRYERGGPY